MKKVLFISLLIFSQTIIYAAKKDFKGLFGSYRREKFVENEGRNNELGVDIMMSTLLPVTSIVKSSESDRTGQTASLNFATFFNVEGSVSYSLNYYYVLFMNFGFYNYETRKQNANPSTSNPEAPQYHQFEMKTIPFLVGAKYRFGTEDLVPYVGIAGGFSRVTRKAFYDYSPDEKNEETNTVLTGELILGADFYISSRIGIRLEASAYYLNLPAKVYDTNGAPNNFPVFGYQANVMSVRYASGLFILF